MGGSKCVEEDVRKMYKYPCTAYRCLDLDVENVFYSLIVSIFSYEEETLIELSGKRQRNGL